MLFLFSASFCPTLFRGKFILLVSITHYKWRSRTSVTNLFGSLRVKGLSDEEGSVHTQRVGASAQSFKVCWYSLLELRISSQEERKRLGFFPLIILWTYTKQSGLMGKYKVMIKPVKTIRCQKKYETVGNLTSIWTYHCIQNKKFQFDQVSERYF